MLQLSPQERLLVHLLDCTCWGLVCIVWGFVVHYAGFNVHCFGVLIGRGGQHPDALGFILYLGLRVHFLFRG